MPHKRGGRHPEIGGVVELDVDNFVDDEEDEFGLPYRPELTWRDDVEFHWKRVKITAKRNCRGLTLSLVALLVLVLCRFALIRVSHEELPETDDSFTDESQLKSPLHEIILPQYTSLYPNGQLEDVEEVGLYDFRFGSSLMLLYVQDLLNLNGGTLPMDAKIPFSWRDWIDFSERLRFDDKFFLDWLQHHSPKFLDSIDDLKSLDCSTFCLLYGCEGSPRFEKACKNEEPTREYPYKFRIDQPMDTKIKEPGRTLLSSSYLYHHMPHPKRVYLLGINEHNVVLQVDQNQNGRESFLRSPQMTRRLMELNSPSVEDNWRKGWTMFKVREKTAHSIHKARADILIQSPKERLRSDRTRVVRLSTVREGMRMDHWNFDHFMWNEFEFLNEQMQKASASGNSLDRDLFHNVIDVEQHRIDFGSHQKYLHEANLYDTGLGSHYDWRFFHTSLILNDYRQSIIHRLARTWLRFCFQNGLKTFIAYGSMLGWSDNGLTLPWDSDIDAVVTMESLHTLARDFNQTFIVDYTAKDGLQSAMTGYFIDINPTYYSRTKGDGNNVIDGRLIDISTGMYLDITALAWTENYLKEVMIDDKIKKLIDKDYKTNHIFALEGGDKYEDVLFQQLKELQNDRKLVHCKNNMVYKIDELEDMIPSYFEGSRAHFPSKFQDILLRFYPKSYKRTFFQHNFKNYLRLWVSWIDCPYSDEDDEEGKLCESADVQQEYRLTKDYTQRHLNMLKQNQWEELVLGAESESRPLRIDEFFIEYSQWLGLSPQEIEDMYTS